MERKGQENLARRFQTVSCLLGLAVVLVGGTALSGWIFNITSLKSLSLALASMKVNSAIAFILLGTSLAMHHLKPRAVFLGLRLVHIFTLLAILIGLATLCEYIFNVRLVKIEGNPLASIGGNLIDDAKILFKVQIERRRQ